MRVFVGFGYNDRDRWIEDQVFPILRGMGFSVVDGKDMHGETLQPVVQSRIEQSDAAIAFFTIREGQAEADFNSHIWVRDEVVHANAKGKPIILVKEEGCKVPDGLLGNRQYILLRQDDRLACVVELVGTLGRRNIRRLKIEPENDELRRNLQQWQRTPGFIIQYRTQDDEGLESLRARTVAPAFSLRTLSVTTLAELVSGANVHRVSESRAGLSTAVYVSS
jgi:hypothetical protein